MNVFIDTCRKPHSPADFLDNETPLSVQELTLQNRQVFNGSALWCKTAACKQ